MVGISETIVSSLVSSGLVRGLFCTLLAMIICDVLPPVTDKDFRTAVLSHFSKYGIQPPSETLNRQDDKNVCTLKLTECPSFCDKGEQCFFYIHYYVTRAINFCIQSLYFVLCFNYCLNHVKVNQLRMLLCNASLISLFAIVALLCLLYMLPTSDVHYMVYEIFQMALPRRKKPNNKQPRLH